MSICIRLYVFRRTKIQVSLIGVIYNPVKSEKMNFRKVKNFFYKNVALWQKPRMGSGHGHIVLGHGHITKNGRITIFSNFRSQLFIFKFQKF